MNDPRKGTAKALWILGLCATVTLACVAIPMYVIRPFVPQGQRTLDVALAVRRTGLWLSPVCLGVALVTAGWAWRQTHRAGVRVGLSLMLLIALGGAWGAQVNIFEKMFHPYERPMFGSPDEVGVETDDKVIAVRLGSDARAYPIRTMGYHHIVNDVVGGKSIAVTYCTLCHTGLVWSRLLDGRVLRFRLAGINNGNALLRDEETNSVWQQSTGEAIFGPLKGKHLDLVHSDELTFALWRAEQPHGKVLKPNESYIAEYESKDWEQHIEATRVVVDTVGSGVSPHQLMLGMTIGGQSMAFPVAAILREKLINDQVAGVPVVVVVGTDGTSIRVYEGEGMTFVRGAGDRAMVDAGSGSSWNFRGCAVEGKLTGHCLREIDAHMDYWFDWMNHHPGTKVFKG